LFKKQIDADGLNVLEKASEDTIYFSFSFPIAKNNLLGEDFRALFAITTA